MTPTNHPLRLPLKKSPGSFPSLPIAPASLPRCDQCLWVQEIPPSMDAHGSSHLGHRLRAPIWRRFFGFPQNNPNKPQGLAGPRLRLKSYWDTVDGRILHHLRNPGMMIPIQIPTNNGFSWFQSGAGFRPSTVCHKSHSSQSLYAETSNQKV